MEEGGKRVMAVKHPFEATTSSQLTWQPGEYRDVMHISPSSFNRRVEPDTRKGCPYISHDHMKLDTLILLADRLSDRHCC
jgi:hypothetical protein